MKIEFEFYFKDEIGDGTPRIAAITSTREYLDNNNKVELVELVDWDPDDEGIYCAAVIEGKESDLKDLIYQHLDIIEDPVSAKDAAWKELATVL